MKKFLLFICALSMYSSLQAQFIFNEAIGGIGTDQAIFARQTAEGGFIIVGWTTSFGAGGWDIYLVKTDAAGTITWTKTYGGPGEEVDCSVQQTTDKGYIITARTTSYGVGSADVYLIKTDSVGSAKWTKTYGGTDWEEGHAVQQTKEGGYVHTGYTKSFGAGNADLYIIKNDNAGVVEWTKTYGGVGDERGHFIHQTADGGYIVIGESTSFGTGDWDYYLLKTDSMGNELWSKTYGGSGDDFGWDVQVTKDKGLILGGWTGSYGAGGLDYFLIKADSLGNPAWARTYGGPMDDNGYALQQTSDGGYIIAGETTSFGLVSADSADVYLVKTDASGNVLWSKTYGGAGDDGVQSVHQTTDGGYLLSGYTNSFGAGDWDFYIVKTDSLGNSGGCNESNPATLSASHIVTGSVPVTAVSTGGVMGSPTSQVFNGGTLSFCIATGIKETEAFGKNISVYPNPAGENITVESKSELGVVSIYNSLGELVVQTKSHHNPEQINISSLQKGIYMLRAQGVTRKIIKE